MRIRNLPGGVYIVLFSKESEVGGSLEHKGYRLTLASRSPTLQKLTRSDSISVILSNIECVHMPVILTLGADAVG